MAATPGTVQKKTFCGICEASCGLVATVDGDRLVELLPDPDHPASRGFACSKGVQFGKVVGDPDRVITPLRRTVTGDFEPASWDEALDDIGSRLRRLRDRHGTESIGVAWGNPIAWNYAATVTMNGLAAALKTKHHYTSASIDVNNYWVAADMMYGNSTVNPLPDFAASDFALIVGANPVVSHGSHAVMHPHDAHAVGVYDHDDVVLTSPWGRVRVPVRVSDEVAVGAVGMTHGWGHGGGWNAAVAAGGSSYNMLTPNGAEHIDKPSGNAFFNGVPVAVAAAEGR